MIETFRNVRSMSAFIACNGTSERSALATQTAHTPFVMFGNNS